MLSYVYLGSSIKVGNYNWKWINLIAAWLVPSPIDKLNVINDE